MPKTILLFEANLVETPITRRKYHGSLLVELANTRATLISLGAAVLGEKTVELPRKAIKFNVFEDAKLDYTALLEIERADAPTLIDLFDEFPNINVEYTNKRKI